MSKTQSIISYVHQSVSRSHAGLCVMNRDEPFQKKKLFFPWWLSVRVNARKIQLKKTCALNKFLSSSFYSG